MIPIENMTWRLCFSHVDRGAMFSALRGHDHWREMCASNMDRVYDEDPDAVSVSFELTSLDELRELMDLTKNVRDEWGVALHLSLESPHWRMDANLANGRWQPASASANVRAAAVAGESQKAIYQRIGEAKDALDRLKDELRSMGIR